MTPTCRVSPTHTPQVDVVSDIAVPELFDWMWTQLIAENGKHVARENREIEDANSPPPSPPPSPRGSEVRDGSEG